MPQLMLINPAKRRKKKGTKTMARKKRRTTRRKSTARRGGRRLASVSKTTTRKTYRRNPTKRGIQGIITRDVVPSIVGGAGALSIDIAMNYLPLPAAFKQGPANLAARGGIALGLGMLLQNFMRKDTAANITKGALTVIAYDGMKQVAKTAMPQLQLGAYDYDDYSMGAYLEDDGLGYISPSPQLSDDSVFEDDSPFMGAYLDGDNYFDDDVEDAEFEEALVL